MRPLSTRGTNQNAPLTQGGIELSASTPWLPCRHINRCLGPYDSPNYFTAKVLRAAKLVCDPCLRISPALSWHSVLSQVVNVNRQYHNQGNGDESRLEALVLRIYPSRCHKMKSICPAQG